MNNFILTAIFFVVALRSKAQSSIIPGYDLAINDEEGNIQNNLIGYENEAIEGLHPPKRTASDYYRMEAETGNSVPKPETQYIVKISRNSVKFQTSGFPAQQIKLSDKESEGIQRLSLALVDLLNESKLSSKQNGGVGGLDWRKLNPVITLSGSDISVQFTSEPPEAADDLEDDDGDKHIFWEFMTNYANNIFEEKVKGLDIPDTHDVELPFQVDDSSFRKFLTTMWRIMRTSVQHAEATFGGWTTTTTTTTAAPERATRSTIATLFAYEEPSLTHSFPSEEFEKRRRDIDSIFYGRGII